MRTRRGGQGPVKSAPPPRFVRKLEGSSETLPPQTPIVPSRAPRPAEKPRTKSISDASGKRKRESRLCHLEAAAPSRSAASEEPRGGNTSRSASALSAAASDLVLPRPRRLRWPPPPLAPARAAVASAAVVPEVAPPAAAAAHVTVSGALAVVRGKCLQYFFYTGPFRASGARAQLARHTLFICIGHRPPAPRANGLCCAAGRAVRRVRDE